MDIKKEIGIRIRELRKEKKLSQETLAEKAHLHPTYISSVERGERNLSLESLKKIADGLGVKMKDLFNRFEHTQKRYILAEKVADYLKTKNLDQLEKIEKIIKTILD
ncbi:MAG: helix-turn-helix transcriptional regulator [Candidatus Omnitrophica bacterium]|jgi:transcriptional regulator with XRE-family HTH domain|nr:helix-turn-helix transcriptional regulator [Candidatus Omnitrophota bacterium]